MRVEVLVNAGAGSVDGEGSVEEQIGAAFAAAGVDAGVQLVEPADFQGTMTRLWSASPRPDALVVAGGDGTVSCAAAVAAGTDIVLGVLPLGTFDHFAKDLGMPGDLGEAAAAIATATVVAVDVAEVNGRVFVNNSVLGSYPAMVAIRDRLREKRGWGKVRAVPVAAWRVFRSLPVHRLTIQGDGLERRHVRTPFVFVGNGVYDNADFGLHRREELTDGTLGIAVAKVVSRWGLVRMVARVLLRGASGDPDLDVLEVPAVEVHARTRHLRVAVDGEVCWLDPPLRYRSRPGALQVLAPQGG